MALFGGGQVAQIIMQGVQMLNNTLQQANALRMEKEQQDRTYAMRQEELEVQKRKIEAEGKLNQLDLQIKTMQARKAEAEATTATAGLRTLDERNALELEMKRLDVAGKKASNSADATAHKKSMAEMDEKIKQFDVLQNTRKSQQLTIAFDDPNQMNRRFQNIGELSDHRESLARRLADPWISAEDAATARKEMGSVDDSLRYRIERAGKEFSLTREEAVLKPQLPPTAPPDQIAVNNSRSAQASVAQPGAVDLGALMKGTTNKTTAPEAKTTLQKLYRESAASGRDAVATFLKPLVDAAPGATEKEKLEYVRSILSK